MSAIDWFWVLLILVAIFVKISDDVTKKSQEEPKETVEPQEESKETEGPEAGAEETHDPQAEPAETGEPEEVHEQPEEKQGINYKALLALVLMLAIVVLTMCLAFASIDAVFGR